jgi:hypothetical protein
MAAHSLAVGSKTFDSKKEALLFCAEILERYGDEARIDEEDSRFLQALLERHPEAQQKIGSGVAHFFKAKAKGGTSCFYLKRTDGTSDDFSFKRCVNAR